MFAALTLVACTEVTPVSDNPVSDPYANGISYPWQDTPGLTALALVSGQNNLSDLTWTRASNAWGPVEKDRSNGEQLALDGKPLTIGGKVYAKGLGVHANSSLSYALGGQCSSFGAEVGLDDEVDTPQRGSAGASVIFRVIADGVTRAETGVLRGNDAPRAISADISGAKELRLEVDQGSDGLRWDHADWGDPRLTCSVTSPPAPPSSPPAPTLERRDASRFFASYKLPHAATGGGDTTVSRADDLAEFLGINTHFSYTDTTYVKNWGASGTDQDIQRLLTGLGVRHLRDRIPVPSFQPTIVYANPHLASLYSEAGFDFITGPVNYTNTVLNTDRNAEALDFYNSGTIPLNGKNIEVRRLLSGLEGPNEYDNANAYKDPNWAVTLRNFMQNLRDGARARANLAGLPIIAPSMIRTADCRTLGDLSNLIEFGNVHSYPDYPYFRSPAATVGFHLGEVKACAQDKPLYATETGYANASGSGISERTVAKYVPRLVAEYFRTGRFMRTMLYELSDINATQPRWGLVRAEAPSDPKQPFKLTPRLAYTALKSLLAKVTEATWDAGAQKWQRVAFTPAPLKLSFGTLDASTHSLVLQKANGTYLVLLWNEIEGFNPTQGNFENAPLDVTLSFAEPIKSLTAYRYNAGFSLDATPLALSNAQVTLPVNDSITLLEVVPNR